MAYLIDGPHTYTVMYQERSDDAQKHSQIGQGFYYILSILYRR